MPCGDMSERMNLCSWFKFLKLDFQNLQPNVLVCRREFLSDVDIKRKKQLTLLLQVSVKEGFRVQVMLERCLGVSQGTGEGGRETMVHRSGWIAGGCSGEIAPSKQDLLKEFGYCLGQKELSVFQHRKVT